jgi:hypothetical protein
MYKLSFLIFMLSVVFYKTSSAQLDFSADSIMLRKFDFEDKEMSEFFDRFNFKEPVQFADNLKPSRLKNIISLLNLKDMKLYKDTQTTNFLKFVSNDTNKVYLNYGDHNWFAFAHCSFLYHGKNILIDIVLKPDGNPTAGYGWIIADVKSELFFVPAKAKTTAFINPMNHEIGFTELSKALNKKAGIFDYTQSPYKPDPLSAFLFMVKNGDLKFNQIDTVDFQFLQIEGWVFNVKNFNRADYNSGWLIFSIKKVSENEKGSYISNHFIN